MNAILKSLSAIVLAFAASFAHASYDDVAMIKSVDPIYTEQMQQQQVCSGPTIQTADNRSNAGSVIGGIAGALLGSHVGGGNGRLAATAAGAVVGAITGDRMDNRPTMYQQQQSCHWEQVRAAPRVTGYLVKYEYQGREFQTTMPYNPVQNGNNTMRVAISVSPR